jgi:polysaccharide biosynthesis transport protein
MTAVARHSAMAVIANETVAARFRDIYTRILMNIPTDQHIVLGVSSAIDGEGKTTVATGLASLLAHEKTLTLPGGGVGNILLVECCQATSERNRQPPGAPEQGLLQCLRGQCGPDIAVNPTALEHLWVLPIGGWANDFPSLIRSSAMDRLLAWIRQHFDLAILDLPSILTSTDAQVLAAHADHLALVVRAGVTPATLVRRALRTIDAEKLVAVLLNGTRQDLPGWLDRGP